MRKLLAIICVCLLMIPVMGSFTLAEEEQVTYNEIALGSKGSEVSQLQTRLKELGYYTKSIDGDYGNGTKTAVASFQSRNGLASNGIASSETVAAIYAEEAIPAPKEPALTITSISKGNTTIRFTVRNNLDVTVDAITFRLLTYDAGGNVYAVDKNIYDGNAGLAGMYLGNYKAISPASSATYDMDIIEHLDVNTKYIGVYISAFHTVDGKEYAYHPSQVHVYKSDKSIEYPINETEPDCMDDATSNRANAIKIGTSSGHITSWTSPIYMYPEGEILFAVREGSICDLAGLMPGDVITAFDDIDALSGHAFERAKLKMLEGEVITVHYMRNSCEYTTQIAQNMDELLQANATETENTTDTSSIAEQLQSLGDLYEKGLLTDEEYAAAKAKIIG